MFLRGQGYKATPFCNWKPSLLCIGWWWVAAWSRCPGSRRRRPLLHRWIQQYTWAWPVKHSRSDGTADNQCSQGGACLQAEHSLYYTGCYQS